MIVVKRAVLLLLLLAAMGTNADLTSTPTPTPDECEGLGKRLPSRDLDKIFGDWILVWSVAEFHDGPDLLTNLSSSQVNIHPHPDNSTFEYTERSVFRDKVCNKFSMNVSMPSDPLDAEYHTLDVMAEKTEENGATREAEHPGKVDFYESSPEGLVMVYNGSDGSYLLIYRKGMLADHHEQLDSAHDHHEKLAECLKFKHNAKFSYSGSQDSCHEHEHEHEPEHGHGHKHKHEPEAGHGHKHKHEPEAGH